MPYVISCNSSKTHIHKSDCMTVQAMYRDQDFEKLDQHSSNLLHIHSWITKACLFQKPTFQMPRADGLRLGRHPGASEAVNSPSRFLACAQEPLLIFSEPQPRTDFLRTRSPSGSKQSCELLLRSLSPSTFSILF